MYDEENKEGDDANEPRYYQVNVVVLEARHLATTNANSKVTVRIGKRRKLLYSKTVKTDAPYFNELCTYHFYLPLPVLLKEILKIAVYKAHKFRKDKLLGSFTIELATVWIQPNHQFYHKWGALTDPRNPTAGVRGYLKCDIEIFTKGSRSKRVDKDRGETIENHLLVPYGEVNDRQRAKFVFSVFRADNFAELWGRRTLSSQYTYVRITYAGMTGKTSIAKNSINPRWNEELSFVDMIPALCQFVHIEICDAFKATARRTLCAANLDLRELSHEGDHGFLPTYGPNFLYLYQNLGRVDRKKKCSFVRSSLTYMCRLLMALRTEVVDYAEDVLVKKSPLAVKPEKIPALAEERYFHYSQFIFFAAIFDILLFDADIIKSKVSIRVNIGPANSLDRDSGTLDKTKEQGSVGDSHDELSESSSLQALPRQKRKWKALDHWPKSWSAGGKAVLKGSANTIDRQNTSVFGNLKILRTLRHWPKERATHKVNLSENSNIKHKSISSAMNKTKQRKRGNQRERRSREILQNGYRPILPKNETNDEETATELDDVIGRETDSSDNPSALDHPPQNSNSDEINSTKSSESSNSPLQRQPRKKLRRRRLTLKNLGYWPTEWRRPGAHRSGNRTNPVVRAPSYFPLQWAPLQRLGHWPTNWNSKDEERERFWKKRKKKNRLSHEETKLSIRKRIQLRNRRTQNSRQSKIHPIELDGNSRKESAEENDLGTPDPNYKRESALKTTQSKRSKKKDSNKKFFRGLRRQRISDSDEKSLSVTEESELTDENASVNVDQRKTRISFQDTGMLSNDEEQTKESKELVSYKDIALKSKTKKRNKKAKKPKGPTEEQQDATENEYSEDPVSLHGSQEIIKNCETWNNGSQEQYPIGTKKRSILKKNAKFDKRRINLLNERNQRRGKTKQRDSDNSVHQIPKRAKKKHQKREYINRKQQKERNRKIKKRRNKINERSEKAKEGDLNDSDMNQELREDQERVSIDFPVVKKNRKKQKNKQKQKENSNSKVTMDEQPNLKSEKPKKILPMKVKKPKTGTMYSSEDQNDQKDYHLRVYHGCSATAPKTLSFQKDLGYAIFTGTYPCLHVTGEWPDTLRRMYRSNVVQHAINHFTEGLDDVENEIQMENMLEASEKLKTVFGDLSANCSEILNLTRKIEPEDTNLCRERKRFYHREIQDMARRTRDASKMKLLIPSQEMEKARGYLATLKRYGKDPECSFPDAEIWLVKNGKKIGQNSTKIRKIVYSPYEKLSGISTGKIQTVLIRNQKSRLVAKLEMLMWFGLESDFNECQKSLPNGYAEETHICPGSRLEDVPMRLKYDEAHRFRCRVHVFQARILESTDTNGLADPFVRAIILGQQMESQIRKETLNPTWNETLLFSTLTFYGPAQFFKNNPVAITIEVIDYDLFSKNEIIGRTLLKPMVKLASDEYKPPKPTWREIRRDCTGTGEVLLAAELLEIAAEDTEKLEIEKIIPIPKNIQPHTAGYRLEILFWGIREVRRKTGKAYVTLECGGKTLDSPIIRNQTNFRSAVQTIDLELPEEHEYKPPLIMKLFMTNPLGKDSYVGNCTVPSVSLFFCQTLNVEERRRKEIAYQEMVEESWRHQKLEEYEALRAEAAERRLVWWKSLKRGLLNFLETVAFVFVKGCKRIKCTFQKSCIDREESKLHESEEESSELNWWVKYYASKEGSKGDTLVVYDEELEAQPEFHGFTDYIHTFEMITGKMMRRSKQKLVVGKVKAAIKLYTWPLQEKQAKTLFGVDIEKGVLNQLPSNAAIKYVLRVYVISCRNLIPKDENGKSDSYLVLHLGNQIINDRKRYIPKQVNPVFGRCFEFKGIFPKEHLLKIKVMDHDVLGRDDLIGETAIDLENRYYTKHHASCGLAKSYIRTGYSAWRDVYRPVEILKTVCKMSNMDEPTFTDKEVRVGNHTFKATTTNGKYKEESQALAVLHRWQDIPLSGFHLVPEHIETRTLYNPLFPEVEQGKIELWIDIFPADFRYLSPAIDIEPKKPTAMELRVIVWNVENVILDDTTFFFNEKMSDIYIRGWLNGMEEDRQSTDVHYRSMNGEGNFNWRFIFPFKYVGTERRMIVYKKQNVFDAEPEELKFPCKLELQVWDNDFFADDFLGSLNLDLSSMPRGAKISTRCNLTMFEDETPRVNLFRIRRTRGWWPFRRLTDVESSVYGLAGKVDLELEILTEVEAKENPVGKGRQEPKALPFPKRPESSFLWFMNPIKTFRFIILKKYKNHLIVIALIVLLVVFAALAIYAVPGYVVKRLIGA